MADKRKAVRCAIYTRKSTDEGLEQEFSSLAAQREAAEAFIASQKHEGWKLLPERYDDGGYSGGSMERPALKRLLADVDAGRIDCVIVYKVDRLSRSLLDFAKLVDLFDKRSVSFVAVTQQFNTSHSLGRLTLNILLSFAQFERETTAERTRDKAHAAKRKGKWIGGHIPLGYDVAPGGGKLVVNEDEAARVRSIFELYLETRSVMQTVETINGRGWRTKAWTTQEGRERTGNVFTKSILHRLLINPIYIGQVTLGEERFDGEHDAIIEKKVWERVQALRRRNGRTNGREVKNKYGALLRGLLYCEPCGAAMIHTYTAKGSRRYRYYVCLTAQKQGWNACSTKSVNAQAIEDAVVERVQALSRDRRLAERTVAEATAQHEAEVQAHRADVKAWEVELRRLARRQAAEAARGDGGRADRLVELEERTRRAEQALAKVNDERKAAEQRQLAEQEMLAAVRDFDRVWTALTAAEREQVLKAIIEQVTYDGESGRVGIRFRAKEWKEICSATGEAA